MLKRTNSWLWLQKLFGISKPPVSGYEISELPNERVLKEFMHYYKTKGVLVVLHSSGINMTEEENITVGDTSTRSVSRSSSSSSISKDPLLRTFISSMNAMNLGNPSEVKIALVPGIRAPHLVREYCVLTYPTTLMFLNGELVYRCVGARTRELSIKSLFMLRNAERNIFSRD